MILVIGYGNPLRRDDGLGPKAARMIEAEGIPGVRVLIRHQLGPELADDLRDSGLAVFIDANALGEPGSFREEQIEPEESVPQSFSHHLRPSLLLGCSKAFYGAYPRAVVFSVTGDSFEHGEGLTPAVERALPYLVERVLKTIKDYQNTDNK